MKNELNLDLLKLESKGYISQDGKRQGINEQFREIKRSLLDMMSSDNNKKNRIMVTSVKPEEGKTFNAINLALSIAFEKDKTVLLVDANVIDPGLESALELETEKGIIEYLRGDFDDIGEVLYQTNIGNLKIIPAGIPCNLSNELLASDRMKNLMKELSTRYPDRVIIFDSPSLYGVTETPIIANLMDQALIVIEENKTSLSELKFSTNNFKEDLAVGVIMNKSTKTRKTSFKSNEFGKIIEEKEEE
jgi:protein-tyrosine kinase